MQAKKEFLNIHLPKAYRHFGRPKSGMSDHQIRRYISLAYHDKEFWSEFIHTYYDLFTNLNEAELKAKTRSVIWMCNYLHKKRSCSCRLVYQNFIKVLELDQMHLDPNQLNFDTQFSFSSSLSDGDCK